ncbi:TonB-dependent receptor [Mangrovibacterium lignilyticum]|uniref:TonB-dependent receptor n=1 Tax=Mangrovibacterium lignilyticum TaxID=2668052 RepID=UPI0013D73FB5|nr:TonB-dependent receptor [Mangrovibacterium lignilyticum]
MRLIALFSLCFVVTAAANSYSQSTKLNLKLTNSSVKEILNRIESESDYIFLYNLNELDETRRVNIDLENASIDEALNVILSDQNLKYSIYDRQIIIRKNDNQAVPNQGQQSKTVTGTVKSSDGEPVPGATVVIKGTTNGAITDENGKFQLPEVSVGDVIAISFVGMVTQEVVYEGQATLEIKLQEETVGIEEIVAVGYGTTSIKDVTGAVSRVSSDDFNKGMVASPEQLIQGRSPGVQITSSSGEPGAAMNINIRGTSSVRSGNNPLFVVDGVPLSGDDVSPQGEDVSFGGSTARNPLNFLNPDDIKDITILKDASATAIYGSRGANGVVIITTKSGAGGDTGIDYSSSVGISSITQKYDVLGAQEYLDAIDGYGGNSSSLDGGSETDWQDEIFRTGVSQNHNISFGNRNDRGDYRVSISYLDQNGIVKESSLKRYTVRVNGNRSFFDDRLKFESQFTVSDVEDSGVPIGNSPNHYGDLIASALYMNPTQPVMVDGEYNQSSYDQLNPVAMLAYSKDNTSTLRSLASLSAELKITKDLSIKTIYGNDFSKSERKYAYSPDLYAQYIYENGKAGISTISRKNNLWENYLTYNKEMENSKLNALLGYSYQSFELETSSMQAAKFRFSDVDLMMNNIAAGESIVGNSSAQKDELQSFFARLNYVFKEKLLLTATMRADGSTRFGDNNKYGYFPSMALGYRLSEESFIPEAFSNLKVRLGWGITGNQEIPHNLYTQRQRYNSSALDGEGEINTGRIYFVTFDNPDLKWETTSQFNAGIDFGFLGNSLSGSIDFYRKKTTDLLLRLNSAQPAPQSFYWTNMDGNIYNTGVEFSLNADVLSKSDFNWGITTNVSYNKNIVKDLSTTIETGVLDGQGLSGVTIQRITNDQPMYTYYIRKFQGFDENGISVYDGDYPQYYGESPIPKVNVGLTNTFSYKNFDLNIYLSGQFGHMLYSNTANTFFYAGNLANGRNVTKDIVTNGESPLNTADPSTRFLESGSFVRLQDVSLGYNVPLKSTSILKSLRFYVTGQNLAVFTNYSGQDPEVNVNKGSNGVPSLGIDYTTYPRSRTILLGLKVKF